MDFMFLKNNTVRAGDWIYFSAARPDDDVALVSGRLSVRVSTSPEAWCLPLTHHNVAISQAY
jgi:hypothetical protein